MKGKSTGVVVTPEQHLDALLAQLQSWKDGKLDDVAAAQLVRRAAVRLNKACWCEDTGRCCAVHSRHVWPHRGCIMR